MRLRKVALSAALGLVAAMSLASTAGATTPAPGYSQFAGCPSSSEIPGVFACIHSTVTGGKFQMGSKEVPITNPMTLSGGLIAVNEETSALAANSKGGLTPVKQKVPGGVVGLTGLTWLLEILGSEALTLYAVTEIAGQPYISEANGSTITLPVKVHLINSVLGNSCYVGSASSPINLHLTVGTTSPPAPNKPITGSPGELNFDPVTNIIHQNKQVYVDNSFAAPSASGCVLTLFGFIPISINGLVNSQSGLPAKAGTNTTIQNMNTELVNSEIVYP